jgi:uncharacterized alkaline shock family protein YloU
VAELVARCGRFRVGEGDIGDVTTEDAMSETSQMGTQTAQKKDEGSTTQVRGEVRSGRRPGSSGGAELVTDQGVTSIADAVVQKVAGMAARQMPGVHALGSGAGRAFGAIKEAMGTASPNTGVSVEVGERQAAIDLDVIVEFGVSIIDLSQAIRRSVIEQIEGMTGLEVTEVNIDVQDVHIETDSGEDRQ